MGREAGPPVTSRAGWGGGLCCAGSASPGTGPARPPRAPDPSGLAFLDRSSGGELLSQPTLPPTVTPPAGGVRPALCLSPAPQGRHLCTSGPIWGDGEKGRGRRRSSPTTSLEGLGQESATWFEEDQGLHAGKLCGIHGQRPETRDGFLQDSHLHAGQCQPALGAASSRHLRRGQQWAAV